MRESPIRPAHSRKGSNKVFKKNFIMNEEVILPEKRDEVMVGVVGI